jgi:hypothetical protein
VPGLGLRDEQLRAEDAGLLERDLRVAESQEPPRGGEPRLEDGFLRAEQDPFPAQARCGCRESGQLRPFTVAGHHRQHAVRQDFMRLGVDADRGDRLGPADRAAAVTVAVRHAADRAARPDRGAGRPRHDRPGAEARTGQRLAGTRPHRRELALALRCGTLDRSRLLGE